MMDCVECTRGVDHCHGTLLLHADGLLECTEPGCADLGEVRHPLCVDCTAVLGGCPCLTAPALAMS